MKQNRRITNPSLHLVTSGTFRWVTTLIRIQEKYIISGWIWVMVRLLVNWVHCHFSVTYINAQRFCKNCILSLNFGECGHLHCTGFLTSCMYFVISPTSANTWISFSKNSFIIFMFLWMSSNDARWDPSKEVFKTRNVKNLQEDNSSKCSGYSSTVIVWGRAPLYRVSVRKHIFMFENQFGQRFDLFWWVCSFKVFKMEDRILGFVLDKQVLMDNSFNI